jgi:hypothetical protein
MERTPLRKEFFEHAREDPYLAVIEKTWARAWVDGYQRALEELAETIPYKREREDVLDFLHAKSYGERLDDALEWLTGKARQAEELVALACLGTKLERAQPQSLGPIRIPCSAPVTERSRES